MAGDAAAPEPEDFSHLERRYPLRNAEAFEAARLGRLEALSDPVTVEWLDGIGLAGGWHCAELGAGAGSMVRHMARRVGPAGSVTAVDRDTTQLQPLVALGNVTVLEADLGALRLPRADYDLVHTRSVLMHLDRPEEAVRATVAALRPGGLAFFEESEGAPAPTGHGVPEPYLQVMVPIAARWTFAPDMVPLLQSLGMEVVRYERRQHVLRGATPFGAFWQHTLASVSELGRQADRAGRGQRVMHRESIEAMSRLLDDPSFSALFSFRHRVAARRPGA